MSKKYTRIVTGILSPNVQDGPLDQSMPVATSDRSHYHHPNTLINKKNLKDWDHMRNKKIIIEHGMGQDSNPVDVGMLVDSCVTDEKEVYLTIGLFDTPEGEWASERINKGDLTGFSVGMDLVPDHTGRRLADKELNEVSLVKKPFYPQAKIAVCASDSDVYNPCEKNDNFYKIPIRIMSSETPAAEKVNNVAAELELKNAREEAAKNKEETEKLRKIREAEMAELTAYRAEKQKALEAQKQSRVKELDTAMTLLEKGMGEKIPEEFAAVNRFNAAESVSGEGVTDSVKRTMEVVASFTGKIGNKVGELSNQNEALKLEIEALKQQMQAKEASMSLAAERINASAKNVYKSQEVSYPVGIHPDLMQNFIVIPHVYFLFF